MDVIFAAVDITSLQGQVTTLLVGFIAVALVFTGYRYARRALRG